MDADIQQRSPAAQRHFMELVREVHQLEARLESMRSFAEAVSLFLLTYDDIVSRCPSHARDEILQALLGVARRQGFADPKEPSSYSATRR